MVKTSINLALLFIANFIQLEVYFSIIIVQLVQQRKKKHELNRPRNPKAVLTFIFKIRQIKKIF